MANNGQEALIEEDYHKLGYPLPYIIVMIDEFGDLMELDSSARKAGEFEDTPTVKSWVKSAGQICRAAGVHLICCTQRASVKVIDGDIKTNLPCRITLRLPTSIDSRTVLGTSGAENLLGKGDMLVQSSTSCGSFDHKTYSRKCQKDRVPA